MGVMFMADAHLKPSIWRARAEVRGDSYAALDKVAELCRKVKPSALVVGGDITDKNDVDARSLFALSRFYAALDDMGVKTYHIAGQHDRGAEGVTTPEAFGSELIDGKSVFIEGRKWYGLSNRSKKAVHEALADVPECDFLVMHQAFRHLLGFEGAWQLEASDIPDHVGAVLVGDIHMHDETGKIYSPGALSPVRADDIGSGHGVYIVEGSDVKWVEILSRSFYDVDASEGDIEAKLKTLATPSAELKPVAFVKAAAGFDIPEVEGILTIVVDAVKRVEAPELDTAVTATRLSDAVEAAAESDKEAAALAMRTLAAENKKEEAAKAVSELWKT